MKVSSAQNIEISTIERGRFDTTSTKLDRVAHAEFQKPLGDGPVAPARRDVVDAGPSREQCTQAQSKNGESDGDNNPSRPRSNKGPHGLYRTIDFGAFHALAEPPTN